MSDRVRSEIFRDVNERIAEITGAWEWDDVQGFLCECETEDCVQSIILTRPDYDSVRSEAGRFLMVAGHDHPNEERIVEHHVEFVIVEKLRSLELASAPASEASREARPPFS